MKKVSYMLAGVLIGGVLLNGNAINAAACLMAERSSQPIYVDGQQVQLEAYNIGGNNYVKLRDVGKAVGFNVSWDGSAVQIDSDAPYQDEAATAQAGRIVSLPTDGSKYVPKTDDGTFYEVKDVSRWENNVYMGGPMPDMPTPTCNWSLFPEKGLPAVTVNHFVSEKSDSLFVRNLYETRRMQYTIYNALGKEPTAWKDGKPLATVELTTPAEYEAYTAKFWPWRESELTDLVHSRPNSRYYVAAWDYYHNHIYQYTRYCILSL